MSGFTWTLPGPAAGSSGVSNTEIAGQRSRAFGSDIWFDVSEGQDADMEVTPAGDWLPVEGTEALRQAVLRRIITNPGEWQTLPDYGVGARLFVKARNTPAARAELEERIRSQLGREPRVGSVEQVLVEQLDDNVGIKVSVQIVPAGETDRAIPIVASVQIT